MVNQREIMHDTESFTSALKVALRQDPDIVLVGELRDLETIQAALSIAETGHLTFGTLHTNSAPKSISRIVDVFPANQKDTIRAQLSMVLEAIISQTLIPRISGGRVAMPLVMRLPPVETEAPENGRVKMFSNYELFPPAFNSWASTKMKENENVNRSTAEGTTKSMGSSLRRPAHPSIRVFRTE